jgi:hypothetical protein
LQVGFGELENVGFHGFRVPSKLLKYFGLPS